MSIRNLKDGSTKPWLCECYPNGRTGKRVRKRFATKGEAAAFERFTMREVDDKPWLGAKPDHRRLSELVALWFKLHGKNLKSGDHTRLRLESMVSDLNNPIASHLNTQQLALYRASRSNKGRGKQHKDLSIASNNVDFGLLKAMFNKLIKLGEWKLPNPADGIEAIKKPQSELAFLTEQEIHHLFKVARQSPIGDELIKVYKVCLATGARVREAIYLKGSSLTKYRITYSNTKGKRNRTVPISEELHHQIYKPTNDRLFTCSYNVVYKWLTIALPHLPEGQATHVLRHTFASHFMTNGGNILVLKEILGHQHIDHTMIYAHFSPNHLSDAVRFNPLTTLDI
ncbi:phage integrase [Vibrio antiquarius]|uniref:phage integrase n=1 Tax=Vibrio antiquarius (strain Ex25) TaxID=150340 RepID=UPI0026585C31|nr:tyrosine-type recombinase/integrase [Vibrio antiquarius]MCR9549087.1 tyrosine-type recombinase/integrase [Vibrio antiquarius]